MPIGDTARQVASVTGNIGPDCGGAALDALDLSGRRVIQNVTFGILNASLGGCQLSCEEQRQG